MDRYEIQIPLFRGFLEHELTLTDTLYDEYQSNKEYYQETYGKSMLINEYMIALRDEEYQRAVCEQFIKLFRERFENIYPDFILEMKYKDLESPQFYQYNTDRLFVDICLADDWRERMTTFLLQNQKWLTDRIREDWSSRDGFNSNMSNEYEDWKSELEQLLPDKRYIGTLIGYMAQASVPDFGNKLNADAFNKVDLREYIYFKQMIAAPRPECEFAEEEEGYILECRSDKYLYTCRIRIEDERFSKILKTNAAKHEYHSVFKELDNEWHLTAYLYDDMDDCRSFKEQIEKNHLLRNMKCHSLWNAMLVNKDGEFDQEDWRINGGKWAYISSEVCYGFIFDEYHISHNGVFVGKCNDRFYCVKDVFSTCVYSEEVADRIVDLAGELYPRVSMIKARNDRGKLQVIDEYGKPLSTEYDIIGCFDENGLCRVCRDGHWGLMNRKYEERICCVYDQLGCFENGLAVAKFKGRYGVINMDETSVVPFEMDYEDMRDFENGYASMKNDEGKWGAIDRDGNVVIPCMYDDELRFDTGGFAVVSIDGGDEFTIDSKNNRV